MRPDRNTVIFDWNGTLLDDARAVHQSFLAVQVRYGKKQSSFDLFREYFDVPFESLYLKLGFSTDELEKNKREMWESFHETYAPLEKEMPLRKGARKVLASLCEGPVECLILSNHFEEKIAGLCAKHEIAPYIHGTLANKGIEDHIDCKPKKERLIRHLAGRKGEGRALIVGDTPEEVRIGHELGLVSVAVTGGFASEERLVAEKPDFLVHALEDLPAIADEVFKGRGR